MRLVRHVAPALVCGLLWAVALRAQESTGSVTGKVVDATTQQPLANVEVALAGTPHRELSRTDGSFALNGVPAGAYRRRAGRIGDGSPDYGSNLPPRGGPPPPKIPLPPAADPQPGLVNGGGAPG